MLLKQLCGGYVIYAGLYIKYLENYLEETAPLNPIITVIFAKTIMSFKKKRKTENYY